MSRLTYDDAKLAEGETFTLLLEDGRALDLTLMEVERRAARGERPEASREPFSLLFRSAPGPLCPQGTYILRDARLGERAIFVVPVGCDPRTGACSYESIFN